MTMHVKLVKRDRSIGNNQCEDSASGTSPARTCTNRTVGSDTTMADVSRGSGGCQDDIMDELRHRWSSSGGRAAHCSQCSQVSMLECQPSFTSFTHTKCSVWKVMK